MSARVSTTVFCPPQLGKPNSSEPKPPGPDTRTRVPQKGKTGWESIFKLFDMLRDRFKAPNTANLPERKLEICVSTCRKALRKHEGGLPFPYKTTLQLLSDPDFYELTANCTHEKVAELSARCLVTTALTRMDCMEPMIKAIPGFMQQTKYANLHDYILGLTCDECIRICEEFFETLNLSAKSIWSTSAHMHPKWDKFTGYEWEKLPKQLQALVCTIMVATETAKRFGFKISSWHPSDPFNVLAQELQNSGPMIVEGFFGPEQYDTPPKQLKAKVSDREVYYWPEGAPKTCSIPARILLVGCRKTQEDEHVYYIRSFDVSDPRDIKRQHIYRMSYRELIDPERICDLQDFLGADASRAIGYAYQRNSSR